MAKKCSDIAISHRTGKPIHGIAAMLQNMSDSGGPDQYRHTLATEAGRAAALTVLTEQQHQKNVKNRTHLKIVG